MKQESLFDDEQERPSGRLMPVGVPGSAPQLNKAQKLFNTLIRKIEAQRLLLQQWHDFLPVYQQRCIAELVPVQTRLAEKRRAMVFLLDRLWDGPALTKRERAKVRDMLLGMLSELLGEGDDEALVQLYDKHSDVSFEEERQQGMGYVEAMASSMFGVELEADHGARTPDELAELIGEKIAADAAARADEPPRPSRPKSGKAAEKAAAKEAAREQARQSASRSLREVYRKLASELHPDREPDAAERTRKTALMQKVNEAYEASDLLALLELQLAIEQIDAAALAGLAQERLAHYNLVLKEQLERLQDELNDVTEPFQMLVAARMPGDFTPETIHRALDADIRELRSVVKEIDSDLEAFKDVRVFKAQLKHYRIGQSSDDGIDAELLEALMAAAPVPRRRR